MHNFKTKNAHILATNKDRAMIKTCIGKFSGMLNLHIIKKTYIFAMARYVHGYQYSSTIYILIASLVRHIASISSETTEQILTRVGLTEASRSNADNGLFKMNQKCMYFEKKQLFSCLSRPMGAIVDLC